MLETEFSEQQFQEAYNRITSHGWLKEDEARLLFNSACLCAGDIVEIGSYQGRSAMLLAHLGRTLYCVDPWDDHFTDDLTGDQIYRRFRSNIQSLPADVRDNVIPVKLRVEDWRPVPAGFVYLDGDHTPEGTAVQIDKALMCSPQCIAIHDVGGRGDGGRIERVAVEKLGSYTEIAGTLAVWHRL